MTQEAASAQYVVLGHIGALHGLRGWLKLHSHTEPPDNILSYPTLYVGSDERHRRMQVVDSRRTGKGLLVQLATQEGEVIADRESAFPLVGAEVAVTRDELPPAEEGEYYWADLIGLEVRTLEGRSLGTVSRILETGANDVLVVQGDRERLIPFLLENTIKTVDIDGGFIVADWDPDF